MDPYRTEIATESREKHDTVVHCAWLAFAAILAICPTLALVSAHRDDAPAALERERSAREEMIKRTVDDAFARGREQGLWLKNGTAPTSTNYDYLVMNRAGNLVCYARGEEVPCSALPIVNLVVGSPGNVAP